MIKFIAGILTVFFTSVCSAWPTKDITIIVPFGPGGTSDFQARTYQMDIEQQSKVSVIIKYLPGAANSVAMNHMLSIDNDDHTFMVTADDFLTGPLASNNRNFERFVPVVILGSVPYVMFGGPHANRETLRRQILEGKTVNVANLGLNGSAHLWTSTLRSGLKINPIPYKSSPVLLSDVIGQHVEYGAATIWTVNTQFQDKKIVPMMISSQVRNPYLPDVPTFKEMGIKGETWTGWLGVVTRKDTSPDALAAMNRMLRTIISGNPRIQNMANQGVEILNLTQPESEKFLQFEIKKIQQLLSVLGRVDG